MNLPPCILKLETWVNIKLLRSKTTAARRMVLWINGFIEKVERAREKITTADCGLRRELQQQQHQQAT
jgi:hypothetical protein